ncbi:hypothetical protein VTK56DRAFT_765 [Thermocarpiscus australiensis]
MVPEPGSAFQRHGTGDPMQRYIFFDISHLPRLCAPSLLFVRNPSFAGNQSSCLQKGELSADCRQWTCRVLLPPLCFLDRSALVCLLYARFQLPVPSRSFQPAGFLLLAFVIPSPTSSPRVPCLLRRFRSLPPTVFVRQGSPHNILPVRGPTHHSAPPELLHLRPVLTRSLSLF